MSENNTDIPKNLRQRSVRYNPRTGETSRTAPAEAANELEKTIDPLTGLFNRKFFMALLDQEFNETKRGQQSKEVMKQAPLVLVMFDFDHFKQYNDNYGHPAGDVMLKKVARIAQRCFRDSDTIARIGGDEFAVLLPRTRATEAMIPTERLRSTVEKELGKNGVTVTIGFSDIADFMKRSKDLYNTVDKFLYKAKKAGKNQTWHPLRDAVKKVNL